MHDRWLFQLQHARRTFDVFDWWRLDEWMRSDAWAFDDGDAALLLVPLDLAEADALAVTRADVAWLRWCAVSDDASPSRCLMRVFSMAEARLAAHGVREVWCVVPADEWLRPYLRDLGYRVADDLLTFEIEAKHLPTAAPLPPGVQVRLGLAADLDALCALDARAFDPAWRYPLALMRRAIAQSSVTIVASYDGMVAGYACAVLYETHGHVVRLAVCPDLRRRGIGTGLLLDAVARLAQAGAPVVSLNTQASNRAAQRLYRRLGFARVGEKLPVMRKVLVDEGEGSGS